MNGSAYLLRLAARIGPDRRGAVGALVAAAAVPLLAFAGLAVDTARGYLLKSRLSYALDAAALAGGRVIFSPDRDETIRQFFQANLPPGYLGATISEPTIVADLIDDTLTLQATATLDTSLMSLLGFETMTVRAETVVRRSVRGMELVLVMDNTGSMRSGNKITAMKNAAADLINILYGEEETLEDFWVALVPYAVAVNVGPQHSDWLAIDTPEFFDDLNGNGTRDSGEPFTDHNGNGTWDADVGFDAANYLPTTWKGCVEARVPPMDGDDTPPGPGQFFLPYLYPVDVDNVWPPLDETNNAQNDGRGPNLGCAQPIQPLLPEKSRILAAIAEMQPWHRGGTMGNLGLAWGWRAISPRWRGLWGGDTPSDMPFDYNIDLMDKVVVMLTDGENQMFDYQGGGPAGSDYGAYGRLGWGRMGGATTMNGAKNVIDARMATTCQAMKDEGILIYTITFQVNSSSTRQLYENCATTPNHYFNSPNNEILAEVFNAIGNELSNLRIAR